MSKVEIFLDGQPLEVERGMELKLSLPIEKNIQLEYPQRVPQRIRIRATPHNRNIMGHCDQILDTVMFNQSAHRAEVLVEGQVVFEGRASLAGCESFAQQESCYLLDIEAMPPMWHKIASDEILKNVDLPFEATLTGDLIKESWTWKIP